MSRQKTPRATGYVRTSERTGGPVFYAKLKLPDGSQPQRRLGKVWMKRTRPLDGYLTRGMAEARLSALLAGDDPLVNLAPTRITFGRACDEYLAYIEDDRKRRPSTVRDYRCTVDKMLRPEFGESRRSKTSRRSMSTRSASAEDLRGAPARRAGLRD